MFPPTTHWSPHPPSCFTPGWGGRGASRPGCQGSRITSEGRWFAWVCPLSRGRGRTDARLSARPPASCVGEQAYEPRGQDCKVSGSSHCGLVNSRTVSPPGSPFSQNSGASQQARAISLQVTGGQTPGLRAATPGLWRRHSGDPGTAL